MNCCDQDAGATSGCCLSVLHASRTSVILPSAPISLFALQLRMLKAQNLEVHRLIRAGTDPVKPAGDSTIPRCRSGLGDCSGCQRR